MITVSIIFGLVVLLFVSSILTRYTHIEEDKNKTKKDIDADIELKINKISIFCGIAAAFAIFYINIKPDKTEEVPIVVAPSVPEIKLTEQQLYLKKLGLKYDKTIDSSAFVLIKKLVDAKSVPNDDFCAFLYETNHLNNNDYSKRVAKLKKVDPNMEMVFIYLNPLCDLSNYRPKSTSSDSNDVYVGEKPDASPCQASIDFIRKDLRNPKSLDYSFFDCKPDWDGSYFIVLRKISAKNGFGVEKEYIYKLWLEYLGGHENNQSSWRLVKIRSEEYQY